MNPMFRTHLLNEKGVAVAKSISEAFEQLLVDLPAGEPRCMALVKTHLETACFYAKKGIAVLPENQLAPANQLEPRPTPKV